MRQLRQPPAEILNRIVQHPRDGSQLVVAIIEPRWREIAGAVTPRDIGDKLHPLPNSSGNHPRNRRRSHEREPEGEQRGVHHGLKLLSHVSERQRHADDGNRGMLHRHGDVQHVDFQGVTVPPRAAESGASRIDDLRA